MNATARNPNAAASTGNEAARFGAIVIGAGHNGLIAAAYLSKAGISTLLVEARDSVGGCASTEIALGGAAVNICNCDHAMIRSTPIADELGLAKHGLRYLDVDPSYGYQHWDGGDTWFLFHNIERTIESLALSYPAEVANYRRYLRDALPMARMIVELAQSVPTVGDVTKASARHMKDIVRALPNLLSWSKRSVGDVVRSFFDAPQLQSPVVTTGPSVWGLGPEFPGTGLGALGYAMRHVIQIGRPEGGSGALTDAIAAAFVESGGKLALSTNVQGVVCEGERAAGVRAVDANGNAVVFEAPIVVVATDPRVAFVNWFGDVPSSAMPMMERYRSMVVHDGYESKIDAVIDEPYLMSGMTDRVLRGLGLTEQQARIPSVVVSPSLRQLADDYSLMSRGRIADQPQFLVQMPSALDPKVASGLSGSGSGSGSGEQVFSLEVLWTPYELEGGWEGSTEPQRWLRRVSELLRTTSGKPFIDSVKDWRLMGPREYESQFFMRRGHAVSYAGTPITALLATNREQSRYETPIAGLYLTGAATYPGAGIWGASGRNVANVILRSDGLRSRAGRTLARSR